MHASTVLGGVRSAQLQRKTVVDFVVGTHLHGLASAVFGSGDVPCFAYRYRPVQTGALFAYMESSQMFGKIVLNP